MNLVTFLDRFRVVRPVAYWLIDRNVFRHALEERLKRDYIVGETAEPAAQVDDAAGDPSVPLVWHAANR
jgi:hypothetical protein